MKLWHITVVLENTKTQLERDLQQITTDHTYVNTLLLNGLITFKQALKHPKRHVLTNALGIKKNVSGIF